MFATALLLVAQLFAPAAEPEDVRGMIRQIGYGSMPAAGVVADAIVHTARSREEAALMVVFAAEESGFDPTARGDAGRSLGLFQIQRLAPACAFAPECAARAFVTITDRVREICAGNPPDEQLAAYVSGSCDRGRRLAAHRARLARVLLEP